MGYVVSRNTITSFLLIYNKVEIAIMSCLFAASLMDHMLHIKCGKKYAQLKMCAVMKYTNSNTEKLMFICFQQGGEYQKRFRQSVSA